MIAPPGSLRTDDQIVTYYTQVAELIGDVPFVLQDFPLVTGVQMSPKVIARIINDLPTCVCLKHEDWPGLEKITYLRGDGILNRPLSILCGNGGMFLPEEMARGADGAMTGFAYPEMMVSVVQHYTSGDTARAQDLFDAYLPLARFEQQPGLGLAIRKYTLARRGIIAHDALRRPGAALSALSRAEVDGLITRQERRLAELG
jgi:4-hydroxy-tetrahydrodipicolinate synthase